MGVVQKGSALLSCNNKKPPVWKTITRCLVYMVAKLRFDLLNHVYRLFFLECDEEDEPAQCFADPCSEAKCSKIPDAKCM